MARRDEGQATVELALVLPLLMTLALGMLQVALIARDQILVVHAAREAARHAAVDPRPAAVRSAATRAAKALKPEALTVEVSRAAGRTSAVTVSVAYRAPTGVVLVGPFLPDVEMGANATMRSERPHAGQE